MNLNKIFTCISIACIPFATLDANPLDGVVTSGSASFTQQGSNLNITNSPGAIIDWQKFTIQKDETTRFIQQSVDSAVLNRVVGQDPSLILGNLQSNGRVFIINPNGILFGADSIVDVGGLVASTLNLSNENFISQQLNFNGDSTNGSINNQGAITTEEGGFVYLIAPNVENHGVITSSKGEVILAAGNSVQLVDSDNPDLRVTLTAPEGEALNVGNIITRGGKTSIYAGLINQQGKVSADSAVIGENGRVFFKSTIKTTLSSSSVTSVNSADGGSVIIKTVEGLTEVAGMVSATGSKGMGGSVQILGEQVGVLDAAIIDASGLNGGGTVLIGGDNKGTNVNIQNAKGTYVGVNTSINANAINEGDGGTVIIWADEATRAYGTITAKGGSVSGNGGFVETSGGYLDVAGLNLDVTAANGNGGTWLLDPYNITITNTTTVNVTGAPNYTTVATGSNIFNGDINAALEAGTSVTIDTTGGGAELGNITVDAAITKTTGPAATLTLKAHNNIITNANISSSSGSLGVTLTADQDGNNTGSVTLNNIINTLGGSVTISAAGDITLSSGTNTIVAANATVSVASTNGAIIGDVNTSLIDILANNGSIILSAANGIYVNGGTDPLFVNASSINFTNSTTGTVHLYNNRTGALSVTGTHNGTGDVIIKNLDATNPLTASGITTSNGYIAIRAGQIDITGTINAGTNSVYLAPYVSSAISIGGADVFDLTQAELNNITASLIGIGYDGLNVYASTADIASASAIDVGARSLYVYNTGNTTIGSNNLAATGGLLYFFNSGGAGTFTSGIGQISAVDAYFNNYSNVLIGSGGIDVTAGIADFTVTDVDINGTISAGTVFFTQYGGTPISIGGSATYNLTQADLLNVNSLTDIYVGATNGTTVDIASVGTVDIGAENLFVRSGGNINIGANSFSAIGGSINLENYSAGADITTGAGTITSSNISLTSLDQLIIGAGGITSAGNLSLNAAGTLMQSGNITTTSAGSILLKANSASLNNINSAGNVGIETNQISIANPIDLAGNNIYIMPLNNNPISIDGSEAFDLTQGELTNILNIGSITIGSDGITTTATTASISSLASTTVGGGAALATIRSLNDITFGANNFSAVGADISFISDAGNIITGAGLLTADVLDLIAPSVVTVGTGGITTTTDIAITAGGVALNGTVTTPMLYLEPFAASTAVSIGGSRAFDINQTDINNIFATTTYIGNNSFLQNANNANLATTTSIDFGARNIVIDANNGIQTGAFTLAATGGNLTLVSRNAGFDITTAAGNIAADNASLTSAGDIVIGAGGLSIANSVTATATNNIIQNGNITSGGPGNVTLNANTQNITMSIGTVTNSGSGNINYTAGGNITLAMLDSNGSNTTLNTSGSILDTNGNGVNNVNANNLTVSSGSNASLDYQISGTLDSTGVIGTADLRAYPVATTTTTLSSTNEPITTTVDTISDTTNSLSTDTSLSSTSTTTTAPLADTSSTDSTIDSTSTETSTASTSETIAETSTTSDEETSATAEETSATAEETKEESKEESEVASAEEDKKQPKQEKTKKLPVCK